MKIHFKYVVYALLIGLMLIGLAMGQFAETWRNGATL